MIKEFISHNSDFSLTKRVKKYELWYKPTILRKKQLDVQDVMMFLTCNREI